MGSDLPRLEFETHGRIASAVAKTRENRALSDKNHQISAIQAQFHQSGRLKSDRLLGLAITKRIAEVMGGTTGVTSVPGRGSTFWFSAVLRKGPQAAVESAIVIAGLEAAEQAIQHGHAGQRILLAEDEPINREIALMLLEDVGLQVDVAEDGQQAVEMARSAHYALILMDMQMPKLNGLEATQLIRQLPGYQSVPIIAITANAFAENKARCLTAGMNDFLSKPFRPKELFAILLRALNQRDG